MDFEFGEHVRILLLGENRKEVLYGELESIAQRGSRAFDDLDSGTKLRAEVNFFSIQKEIKEDKEITEAILMHNLKVENIKLYDEICRKKKNLEKIQRDIECAKIQYEKTSEKLIEAQTLINNIRFLVE